MARPVTIKIVRNGVIVDTALSTDWDVNMDSLSPENSTFTLAIEARKTQVGDIIICEQMGDPYGMHYTEDHLVLLGNTKTYDNIVIPFYIGLIVGYDLLTITAKDLVTGLCDQKVVERSWNGNHPSEYLINVFRQYIISTGNDISPTGGFVTEMKETWVSGNTSWKRTIQQVTAKDMNELRHDIQKYYQTIISCGGYTFDETTRKITFYLIFHNILNDIYSTSTVDPRTIDLDNKAKYPEESIDIFVQPVAVTGTNCVNLIQNGKPEAISKAAPVKVYMENSGTMTRTPNVNNLRKPLKIDTVVYEPHEDPKHVWTDAEYISMASPSMSKDSYAHTVKFDRILEPYVKTPRDLTTIGRPVRIYHQRQKLDSYITGWKMNAKSDTISIMCGNIRTNLPLYIKYAANKK